MRLERALVQPHCASLIESFWSALKREIRWIRGTLRLPTRAAARLPG